MDAAPPDPLLTEEVVEVRKSFAMDTVHAQRSFAHGKTITLSNLTLL
jgi:hypothetical protein